MRKLLASLSSFAIYAVALLSAVTSARGEDCHLKQIAEFDMVPSTSGTPMIAAMLNDKPTYLMVDTGAAYGLLQDSVVRDLGLPRGKSDTKTQFSASGSPLQDWAVLPLLQLGNLRRSQVGFLITDDSVPGDPRAAGTIGIKLLSNYDLEFDFSARKLKLFSQRHCNGNVVYWAHDFVETSLKFDAFGLLRLPMKLDRSSVTAILDTGSSESFLEAHTALDLKLQSDKEAKKTDILVADGKTMRVYLHQFKTLKIEGMTIQNPWLWIMQQKLPWRLRTEDVVLGMDKLLQLHLYIAYGERKLYFTAADAH